jgi:hypothetical protein
MYGLGNKAIEGLAISLGTVHAAVTVMVPVPVDG